MQALPRSAARWSLRGLSSTPLSSRATFVCASCQFLQNQQSNSSSQRQRRSFASSTALRDSSQAGSLNPSPPTQPPSSGHTRLRTRRLISISGEDAPHFLQGLVTTSINGINGVNTAQSNGTDRSRWFYCGFFNALGRVLHDVFIYPVPSGSGGEPHFMIEVDAVQLTTLLKHLKRYKLRSKIFLRAIEEDEMSVWQIWSDADTTSSGQRPPQTHEQSDVLSDRRSVMIPDLRAPGMGYRILTVGADLDMQALDLPPELRPAAAGKTDEGAYRVRRYLRGVPEGSAEITPAQALPQESNMDLMGGIDFRKGCYVGQELTIRTRHRGVVRKRILPCMLYGENEAVPTALEYRPAAVRDGIDLHGLTIGRHGKKGRSTGTFLAGTGNIGLALCRVQLMSDLVVPNDTATLEFDPAAEFVIQPAKDDEGKTAAETGGESAVRVKAFVPDWLRQRIDEDAIKHHPQ